MSHLFTDGSCDERPWWWSKDWWRWGLTGENERAGWYVCGEKGRARVGAHPVVLQLSGMTQRNWNRSWVFCAQAGKTFERWSLNPFVSKQLSVFTAPLY